MKFWAQFYKRDPIRGGYIEAVGDRSVVRLDGYLSIPDMKACASQVCKERGFDGYAIIRGESLLRAAQLTIIRPAGE